MAEELWLDADRVTKGGRDLASAGKQLTSARLSAGGELAATSSGRPWGTDPPASHTSRTVSRFHGGRTPEAGFFFAVHCSDA